MERDLENFGIGQVFGQGHHEVVHGDGAEADDPPGEIKLGRCSGFVSVDQLRDRGPGYLGISASADQEEREQEADDGVEEAIKGGVRLGYGLGHGGWVVPEKW